MKVNILKYCLIFIAVICFSGCESKYSWDFQSGNYNKLIVDGIITSELKAQCIKLSFSNPRMNMTYRPYSGANIVVSDGINQYEFIESNTDSGSYFSAPFKAVLNKTYKLTIVADSEYNATASMVPVNHLDPFAYTKNDTIDLYKYLYPDKGNPAMTEVNYNWSLVPEYCEKYGSCEAKETFYTLNDIDENKIFAPDKEIIWFPKGTIIIRKKYSLTQEHQDFLRSLLMETQWSGGIFDVQHGNVSTNLSNGALGFFGVCMVESDTILFNGN
jgi:Domain of unknown function (DUF4249)